MCMFFLLATYVWSAFSSLSPMCALFFACLHPCVNSDVFLLASALFFWLGNTIHALTCFGFILGILFPLRGQRYLSLVMLPSALRMPDSSPPPDRVVEVLPAEQQTTAILCSIVVCVASHNVHQHTRDSTITFVEVDHVCYLHFGTAREVRFPMSVSDVWSRYFETFDADRVLAQYYSRWCVDPSSKYYDIVAEKQASGLANQDIRTSIKDTWCQAGQVARAKGTYMHRQIDMALNGLAYDVPTIEMEQFRMFVYTELESRGWQLYRSEWSVYDEDVMVAGQIDALFHDSSGKYTWLTGSDARRS